MRNFMFFVCGAICGCGATYIALKKKYEDLAQ